MRILICICVAFEICLFVINIIMKNTIKKINRLYSQSFSKQFIINTISAVSKELKILYGSIYSYNNKCKAVRIIDKDNYDQSDMCAIYHEIGHYLDSKSSVTSKLYQLKYIFFINYFILGVAYIIFIYNNIRIESLNSNIFFVSVLLCFLNVIYICYFEIRASKLAAKKFNSNILGIYNICLIQQVVQSFAWALLFFIVYIALKK